MTTATKAMHTPGPWIFNGRAIEQDVPRDALAIAYCESEQNDDWEANARLIAAAPGLLEELKRLLYVVDNESRTWAEVDEARESARAAIVAAD